MTYHKLLNENCLDTLRNIHEGEVDMVMTSPPYDDLRAYNGYTFYAPDIIKALYPVMSDGGVVVWVISDATINGDESGSSFQHAMLFQEMGFLRWDTMIWKKSNPMPTDGRHKRYTNAFEYMFVFSKGKPRTCNKIMVPTVRTDERPQTYPARREKGLRSTDRIERPDVLVKEMRPRTNVWEYPTCDPGNIYAKQHPATYPVALARDHVLTWSNPGDLIYDPFTGSGTTAIAALQNSRRFLGSEISAEYYEIASERIIAEFQAPLFGEGA